MRQKGQKSVAASPCGLIGLAGCLVLQAASAEAQALPPMIHVPASAVNEHVAPASKSQGTAIVGLIAADVHDAVPGSPVILTVSGLSPTSSIICVSMRSLNDIYSARFAIKNPRQGNTLALEVPLSELATGGHQLGELTVAVTDGEGTTCAEALLPFVWKRARPSGDIYVAVNALGNESVRIENDSKIVTPCRELTDPELNFNASIVLYDHICKYTLPKDCSRDHVVKIRSSSDSGPNDPDVIRLRGACPS